MNIKRNDNGTYSEDKEEKLYMVGFLVTLVVIMALQIAGWYFGWEI